MELTEERLAEIERRAAAATPGPWAYDGIPYEGGDDPTIYVPHAKKLEELFIAQTVYDQLSGTVEHEVDADTIFIAHAREDVPALVAEIRRLRAKVAEMEEQIEVTWKD